MKCPHVCGRDEGRLAESLECGHRAGEAQLRQGGGVLELEQLHRPLDVGQAPVAKLEVGAAVGTARQSLRLHPGLEGADVTDLRRAQAVGRVTKGVDEGEEVSGQLLGPVDRRGPQQRLELPRQGPALVVGAVRVEAAHERSALALGPEVSVETDRRVGSVARELTGELLHDRGHPCLHLRLGLTRRWAVDEEHVGVGGVAHLCPTEAAHADDEDLAADGPLLPPLDVGDDRAERGTDRRRGEVGQGLTDSLQVEHAEQVGEGDPQQLVPADGAHGRDGLRRRVAPPSRSPHRRE